MQINEIIFGYLLAGLIWLVIIEAIESLTKKTGSIRSIKTRLVIILIWPMTLPVAASNIIKQLKNKK